MNFRLTLLSALVLPLALHAESPKCPAFPSHIDVESGTFSTQPGVSFRLRHFVAALVPLGKTSPSCFQKMTVVTHAEIFISNESLTNVFASKLGAAESNIRDFKVENSEGRVKLTGKITKIIPINFTIEGPLRTDGKLLLLDTDKIKADGIPVKALLDAIGQHLSTVLGFKGVSGVNVQQNTLSFSPELIAHLKGHIEATEAVPEGLKLRYGPPIHVHSSGT